MKKKVLSLLLVLTLCIGLETPAFAATVTYGLSDFGKGDSILEISDVISEGTYSFPDMPQIELRVFYTDAPATVTILRDIDGPDVGCSVQKVTLTDDGLFSFPDDSVYVELGIGVKEEVDDWRVTPKGAAYILEEGAYYFWAANYSSTFFIVVGSSSNTQLTLETPSSWAVESVNSAITAGIVPEALQSKYTQATTRAEFCALAVVLYETVTGTEITERSTFSDTTDINVEKMAALGVVAGVGDGKFAPTGKLTREQAATMLSRLATAIGKPLTSQAPTFADNGSISSWAFDAVGQMQATGIMGGVGDNTFSPTTDYTREQSIITIMRLFDVVK